MAAYYLAVDIGASSGRHILGHMENGKMVLEEIYRFENGMVKKDGELCWEFDRLFKEVVNGLKKCKEIGKLPVSMGVDTWGVDFVLLDKDDKVLGNTVGYLSDKIREEVGFDLEVVAPATHDTGSAVLAVPANDDAFIYISSRHWYRNLSHSMQHSRKQSRIQ